MRQPLALKADGQASPVQPRLLSLNVGLPRDVAWQGRVLHTGIWKAPVEGRRWVSRLNVDGDGQGDRAGHGGVNRAVFVYQIESYAYWQQFLGRSDFSFGQFGENFTVAGLPDDEVCIGDRYQIGDALFEVSQPRVTCFRLGVRMDDPRVPSLAVAHRRPGFYLRTLREGHVQAGDAIEKVASGPQAMTVAQVDGLLYLPERRPKELRRALQIPALSEGWQGSFRQLLADSTSSEPKAAPLAWRGLRALRVESVDRESTGVVSISLRPADGGTLPAPLPGQYLSVRVQLRPGAVPVVRSYSLSGPPAGGQYRISVQAEPGGTVSAYLHHELRRGDTIDAGAPRGAFVLQPTPGPIVLISAGIGATPTLAMLHALTDAPDKGPLWWVHAARDSAHHPFRGEVARLLAGRHGARSIICYSTPLAADRLGRDYDLAGHLTAGALAERGLPLEAHFYLCGPKAFMSDITSELMGRGVPAARVHTEIFGPNDPLTPGVVPAATETRAPHPPPGEPGHGPLVSFARANLSVPWNDAYRSLLEFAEACDVPVRWACRTGVCHACQTGLVDGTVHDDPDPLEPAAAGDVLLCCSRPDEDVVLDL